MNKRHVAKSALLMLLMTISAVAAAQPSLPDAVPQTLPELGAVAPRSTDIKPRIRPQFKPRMKSDELRPEMRPELKPEMSPGMQPNSQKPLRTDAPTRRNK